MIRWLLGILAGLLIVCSACAWLGYSHLKPHLHSSITNAMADSLNDAVSARIDHGGLVGDRLRLRESDLDLNTEDRPGEWGWEVSPGRTAVYGIQIVVTDTGLIAAPPGLEISGTPVVNNGRIDLIDLAGGSRSSSLLLSKRDVERAIEGGLNTALAAHGLVPVAIELVPGVMTIQVQHADGRPFELPTSASPTPVTTARWVD